MVGPCSCGSYQHHGDSCSCNNSYTTLFNYTPYDEYDYQGHHHHHEDNNNNMHGFSSWPSPNSSVDCTLSLGTPSTRLSTNENDHQSNNKRDHQQRRSSFSWNIFHSNKHSSSSSSSAASAHKSHRGGNAGSAPNSGAADPLSARRCANCDTTSTPLWRNGPRGPKSLCNACGIRFKKEERRAAAAATNCGGGSGGAAPVMDTQHMINSPWVHHQQYFSSSSAYGNEYRFMEDDHHDHHDNGDSGMPFFSWHLNVRS